MEEAAKAQAAFAKSDPGHSLAISPLRSLERQVFVVVRGGQVIAGTEAARIGADWTASGWAKKVADAAHRRS